MLKTKFESFPKKDIKNIMTDKLINIRDEKIKDPNNPTEIIDVKLIKRSW